MPDPRRSGLWDIGRPRWMALLAMRPRNLAVTCLAALAAAEVEQKVADYLAAGARLVWLIDPRERRVSVRYARRR